MKRWLPPVIAVVVLAAVGAAFWSADRSAPIPSAQPSSAPAMGSCWQVTPSAVAGTLPWPGQPVGCTASHNAEIFYRGQVDHNLIKQYRAAKGQAGQAATILMGAEARSGCTGHANAFLGGAWRGAQLTIVPDFVAPEKDGFFACVAAQVADPGGTVIRDRTASLAGALNGPETKALDIDCYAQATGGALTYAPCTAAHKGEYVGLYTVTPLGAQFNGTELAGVVTSGCQALLNRFLGLASGAPNRTDIRSSYVGPTTSATWLGSDQSYACYATAATTLDKSIKGLGTRSLPQPPHVVD
jgi:hypothetical protein